MTVQKRPDKVSSLLAVIQQQQSPKLLAVLVRVFGAHNLELAEDVLQESMVSALDQWQHDGVPDNPKAWLLKVAKNRALDKIRQTRTQIKYAQEFSHVLQSDWTANSTLDACFSEERIQDDQLRMLFMCSHEDIAPQNRLPFMLKTLCGLSISAIAKALLLSEATVKKRLLRTKQKLKEHQFRIPEEQHLPYALNSVHTTLYLLFNEGFHSTSDKHRTDTMLCKDALAQTQLLMSEKNIANQDTFGLSALMQFLMARSESKVDSQGRNIPIDAQDRSLWDGEQIVSASALLDYATHMNKLGTGRYFLEACIAQQHCIAASFELTNWPRIYALYQQLFIVTKSPVTQLNLAVAQAYCGEVEQAIQSVERLKSEPIFIQSHLPLATLAHLYAMKGNKNAAHQCADEAIKKGGSKHENAVMLSQINKLIGEKG
ncbi:RNA polymerase sigma factor [Aliiglaciecola sp. M165]|uniref:RNA polymerase sigma factor n=1 Tax=Aliiglaciecola sp. M165 TaxID=2593649 RepID=UPI00117D917A|nr:sigma-70 family RNA polymerase sigma factor [Aliiglaciecola sp. M165]TRY29210.1 sigma-70 family RNA polymerase sigma factor [Aliiglaciecola sp. M165]